jgi:hypothetical protein
VQLQEQVKAMQLMVDLLEEHTKDSSLANTCHWYLPSFSFSFSSNRWPDVQVQQVMRSF